MHLLNSLKSGAAILGVTLAIAIPAFAQTNAQNTQTYNAQPVYNAAPVYNSGANVQPYSMQQAIAGKNAPSYNYNPNPQPYNFNATGNQNAYGSNAFGAMTPEQATMLRAQRDAQAQAYQAQYMEQLRAQQQGGVYSNSSAYQGNAFSQLYNSFGQKDEEKVPTKRRVVYREKNNPLIEPPRLFNPDQ